MALKKAASKKAATRRRTPPPPGPAQPRPQGAKPGEKPQARPLKGLRNPALLSKQLGRQDHCGTCHFLECGEDHRVGLCRVRVPFVTVRPGDWCGDHRPKR